MLKVKGYNNFSQGMKFTKLVFLCLTVVLAIADSEVSMIRKVEEKTDNFFESIVVSHREVEAVSFIFESRDRA